jgi:hypothetical protein
MSTKRQPAFVQELKEITKYVKLLGTTFSGLFTLVAALLPLTGFVSQSLAPPWPPASPVIPVVFSIVTIITLFLVFRVYSETLVRKVAILFCVSGVVIAIIYLFLAAAYMTDVNGHIYLTGFALSSEAKNAVEDPQGPRSVEALLDYFGYASEDRIWTGRTVLMWLFLVLCTLGSALFAGGISLLIVANIVNQRTAAGTAGP